MPSDRGVSRFLAWTFGWSWAVWAPLVLAGRGVLGVDADALAGLTMPLVMLGAFGPAVGACVAIGSLDGRAALVRFLRRFASLRFGWRVWTAIFGVLGSIGALAWVLPELFGDARVPMQLPGVYVFPIWLLVMVFLGGGQEEVGWRGYLLGPLEARFGRWGGNVALALVWTAWHLPLWFVRGSTQEHMPIVSFVMMTVGLSFFFSWVIQASGGRLLSGLVAHGAYNAFIPLFPTHVMAADAPQARWWIHQALVLVVGVLFMWRVTRRRSRSDQGRATSQLPPTPSPVASPGTKSLRQ